MNDIVSPQLVYSRLTAEEAIDGTPGYQTMCYTRDSISDAEKREIQARLFYMPKNGHPDKHVFFHTATGRVVTARITWQERRDEFGRGGQFLGHALVMSPVDFSRIAYNPFTIFHTFQFFSTVAEVRKCANKQKGDIRPAKLSLSTVASAKYQQELDVDGQHLSTLFFLAAQAKRSRETRRSVGFVGDCDKLFRLLESIFQALPPLLRAHCTFDTLFVGGSLGESPYWAVGLPSGEPQHPHLVSFDLNNRQFSHRVNCKPTNTFEQWLLASAAPSQRKQLTASLCHGYALGRLFDGAAIQGDELKGLHLSLLRTFQQQYPIANQNLIVRSLLRKLGNSLAHAVLQSALEWTANEDNADKLVRCLTVGFDVRILAKWILESFYNRLVSEKPTQQLEDLKLFLNQNKSVLEAPDRDMMGAIYSWWMEMWMDLAYFFQDLRADKACKFLEWMFNTFEVSTALGIHLTDTAVLLGPLIRCTNAKHADRAIRALVELMCPHADVPIDELPIVIHACREIDFANGFGFADALCRKRQGDDSSLWASYFVYRDEIGNEHRLFLGICFECSTEKGEMLLRQNLNHHMKLNPQLPPVRQKSFSRATSRPPGKHLQNVNFDRWHSIIELLKHYCTTPTHKT